MSMNSVDLKETAHSVMQNYANNHKNFEYYFDKRFQCTLFLQLKSQVYFTRGH